MIICLYHGSSFKDVNETQTRMITNFIETKFPNHKIIESYYSNHVLSVMERRNTPLLSFYKAIEDNYQTEDNIYVLATNMMNGSEYQKIIDFISCVDSEGKIKITKPLLDSTNIDALEVILGRERANTLFVGHGMVNNNREYEQLNANLNNKSIYVTTLKSDTKSIIANGDQNKLLTIKPLMITCAYHAKKDIEISFDKQCQSLGYQTHVELQPLALNYDIHKLLYKCLNELIK